MLVALKNKPSGAKSSTLIDWSGSSAPESSRSYTAYRVPSARKICHRIVRPPCHRSEPHPSAVNVGRPVQPLEEPPVQFRLQGIEPPAERLDPDRQRSRGRVDDRPVRPAPRPLSFHGTLQVICTPYEAIVPHTFGSGTPRQPPHQPGHRPDAAGGHGRLAGQPPGRLQLGQQL